MQLTARLYEIAKRVPKDTIVVDVGTDHGYIPIYLSLNNLCKKCIASDVNQGPLDSAKRHSDKYNIHTLELRKGSGLQTIKAEDAVEVVIIAGMGGLLIIDILRNDLDIVKGVKKLILQPQTNVPEVRRFLHTIGYRIEEEVFLTEEGKYYTIICAVHGEEKYLTDCEYEYGKYLLEHTTDLFKGWMNRKENVFEKIYTQIQLADATTQEVRKAALDEEYKIYQEALACMK